MNVQQAREKIREAIRENETGLDLSVRQEREILTSDDLEELMPEILKMTKLKRFAARNNKLSNISFLAKLKNLERLWLGANKISDLSVLRELKNLKQLHLWSNLIQNISPIQNLTELKSLDLDTNKISDISALVGLENLEALHLAGNQINDISPLVGLENLETLHLAGNQINDISPLVGLENLETLHLAGNQINDISPLVGLENLETLHLAGNQINDISPLVGLENLKELRLTRNPALEEKIPSEILDDPENPQRIISYWLSITRDSRPLNEAKVVVVGQGSVGKTTLIERIINGKFIVPEKTDGIDIRKWGIAVNDHQVQLNIWDFGGQEIMHATHQFFLTKRSLYLLALDCRLDKDENRLEYWLRKIESLSENSPVIIVGTKVDQHQFDLNQKDLLEKFPYIKGFYGISAKTGDGIEELKGAITAEIGGLEGVHNELPKQWFDVKAKLEKLKDDLISFERYSEICKKTGVDREDEDTDLVDLLHDLGVVLCFHKDTRLRDTNVLQPEWVTNGVYKILNARSVFDNGGILKVDMLSSILDKEKYPKTKYRFILDMMKKFELCFEISEDEFLIPDLLKQEEPDTGQWSDVLRFQYQYEVFFSSIVTRFIVRMHERIDSNTYWRNGVVLAYKVGGEIKNRALIKADSTAAKISIAVSGEQNTRRDFLSLIRGIFEGIHNTIPNLTVSGKVPVPGHENIVVDYYHLIALEGKGINDHYPEGLTDPVSIKDLLNGINTTADVKVAEMNQSEIDILSRIMGEIGDYFDQKLDRKHAELIELLNTAKSSGPKGKIKLSIPILKQLGVDISTEKDFSLEDTIGKIRSFIRGQELTELKLKEGSEPKKLKD
jgi:internalin A